MSATEPIATDDGAAGADERYLLVSADGHAGPPAEHYRAYLEGRYVERYDAH